MSFIALANRSDLSPSSRPANSFVIGTAVINTHLKPKQPGETAHCRFSGLFIVVFRLQRDGACRYQWENKLLEYFGADCTNSRESDFDKFHFETAKDNESEHYNQLWFQMTLFLEYNFRNAIAPLHYKLFDFSVVAKHFGTASYGRYLP